jgi:putative RNA 2'-phosphotransferase
MLRHRPEKIGLTLDAQGWAAVDELLTKMNRHGMQLTRAQLDDIVAQDDKQRYRDYVHLSPDEATARKVGARHGEPLVLVVNAGQMHAAGFIFYRAANGVWLTDRVPPAYLHFPAEG